jgi:AmmeMemoRadiSam system protein B/AmmeMemoRadiSam system protein A
MERLPMKHMTLLAFSILILLSSGCHASSPRGNVRPPAVAGKFYPADSTELRLAVTHYLGDAIAPKGDKPVAIIVPHAGYVFSGQIAADAFEQASGQSYDDVIILGTNHTTPGFDGVSIYAKGSFQTPLGDVPIDEHLTSTMLAADKDFTFNPDVHTNEHSIEVELPFIQQLFPSAKIVPIVIGTPDPIMCAKLGHAIATLAKDHSFLIVASSDLSHYPKYADACRTDKATLEAISLLDAKALESSIRAEMTRRASELVTCACGEGPILTAIAAAGEIGAHHCAVISYANSGNTAMGDYSRVVGYGAVVMSSGPASSDTVALQTETPPDSSALSDQDKRALLSYARKTLDWYLSSETAPLPRGFSPAAQRNAGAFVTLNENGELRGCIGHMVADMPLCEVVGNMVLMSALEDRRFQPVERKELDHIEIEISMLTPATPVPDVQSIVLGRDGVVIHKDRHSAVFLPQVATEQGWTRDEMLSQLCRKAGLPTDAWKQGAQFETFQAVVFSEREFPRSR